MKIKKRKTVTEISSGYLEKDDAENEIDSIENAEIISEDDDFGYNYHNDDDYTYEDEL